MDRDKFIKVFLLLKLCACVDLFKTNVTNSIDLSRLTALYIPVCGTRGTCMNFEEDVLPLVFSSCPDCSCQPTCMFTDNRCCFQTYFQSSYFHCRKFNLVSSYYTKQSFSNVVDTCPPDSDKELVEKCEMNRNIVERMKYPPVAELTSMTSYWNRFCASCHGVNLTVNWQLSIECLNETDFNYLSSYEEIVALAELAECSVEHTWPITSSCSIPDNTVGTCNVSGTWTDFDPDIRNACESDYHLKYENYKNVFCAMCNPPVFFPGIPQISCTYDKENELARACLDQPKTALAYPFSNIYCQFCHYEMSAFLPVNRYTLQYHTYQYRKGEFYPFEYRTHMNYLTKGIFDRIDLERKKLTLNNTAVTDLINLNNRRNFNISKLVNIAIAAFAEKTCNSSFFQMKAKYEITSSSCSCEVGCTTSCCDDVTLTYPFSCINDAFPPKPVSNGGYYILDGNQITDKALYSLCKSQNTEEDVSLHLPVTHYAQGKAASYRNVYCMIGSTPISSQDIDFGMFVNTHPWTLVSSCPQPVSTNWLDVNEFLKYTTDVNCKHSVYPHDESIVCDTEDSDINKCNQTGTWNSLDADVIEACEKSEKFRFPILYDNALNVSYKNKFCKICNPYFQKDAASECASDILNASHILHACKELPGVHVCTRFKNSACEICNGVSGCNVTYSKEMTTSVQRSKAVPEIVDTYRSILILSEFDSRQEISTGSNRSCSQVETIHQDTCKRFECFPGKVYKNNSCFPLIDGASDLRFSMNLKMRVIIQQSMQVEDLLSAVNTWIEMGITNSLGVGPDQIQFENSKLLTINMCTALLRKITLWTEIAFFLPIPLTKRMENERSLVNFTRSVWHTVLNGIDAEIQNNLHTEKGLTAERHNVNDTCKFVKKSPVSNSNKYTLTMVNDLLICRLVTLTKEEFVVESSDRIRLFSSNTVLSFQQFRVTENGSYQTCFENMLIGFDFQDSLALQPVASYSAGRFYSNFYSMSFDLIFYLLYVRLSADNS